MASVSRTIGLAALVAAAPGAARAETVLQGSYQAGVLGRVELSTEKERLVAYASGGGPCGFESRRPVLEGEFQGNVLVGQLTVCLLGASCPPVETLPILALYSPEERTLTAYVKPRAAGCQAPVVGSGGVMVLAPEGASPAEPVLGGSSSVARLRTEKRSPEAAKEALERGNRMLGLKDWSGSAAEFERSITHDDRNWVAFFGLGTAWLMRGQAPEAIEALNRARALNPREPSIHYNLACAYSRLGDRTQALGNLGQAVRLGFAIAEGAQDTELEKLLLSDPASFGKYVQLAQQAFNNYSKPSAGRRQQMGP
ncbi:tetratricopeptide repeat protein [Vitiosangium sp. GDMCC 1.1324]|uniref:tetratricopeptide repeat protein n=1 Tax=Vitiosangium sp. (strain GDMCC 1.1324) TaxID=2138576 RepID=UPI000D4DA952|nr:tetratricopeptide repeat protein [Vitiosangium sp. GDMCC 1.1324]PTL78264.1 hypothetical protein DAT35_40130 [Vitiosangium sp. GDMCC 1.1324]